MTYLLWHTWGLNGTHGIENSKFWPVSQAPSFAGALLVLAKAEQIQLSPGVLPREYARPKGTKLRKNGPEFHLNFANALHLDHLHVWNHHNHRTLPPLCKRQGNMWSLRQLPRTIVEQPLLCFLVCKVLYGRKRSLLLCRCIHLLPETSACQATRHPPKDLPKATYERSPRLSAGKRLQHWAKISGVPLWPHFGLKTD